MTTPNPEAVAKHVIRLMGGHEQARQTLDADFRYVKTRWEQDTVTIGRILRAHLFVEHFMTEYVQARNPELGSLEEARASFSQKVALVDKGSPVITHLLPGIRRLNSIRNRIAHTLRAEVTEDDLNAFLQMELFRASREALARGQSSTLSTDPIVVLEEFSMHAGMSLHACAAPLAHVWSEALRAVEAECSEADAT